MPRTKTTIHSCTFIGAFEKAAKYTLSASIMSWYDIVGPPLHFQGSFTAIELPNPTPKGFPNPIRRTSDDISLQISKGAPRTFRQRAANRRIPHAFAHDA